MAIDRDKVLAAAQKYASKRQYEKAIAEYRKILLANPSDDRTLMRIVDIQIRMPAHEAAVATFQELAAYYAGEGFTAKAVAAYKQALNLVQQHLPARIELAVPVLSKLAQLYKDQGLIGDAAVALEQHAAILEKAGRGREAIEVLRQLATLRGDDPKARMRLAEALAASGETAAAVAELRAVADRQASAGMRHAAIPLYERMIELEPDPALARKLATLVLDRGAPGDGVVALNHLRICFQSTQRDPATLGLLARAFDAAGQRAKALETRKLQLKTLMESAQVEASRELVAALYADEPNDEDVRHAAIQLGMLKPPRKRTSRAIPAVRVNQAPADGEASSQASASGSSDGVQTRSRRQSTPCGPAPGRRSDGAPSASGSRARSAWPPPGPEARTSVHGESGWLDDIARDPRPAPSEPPVAARKGRKQATSRPPANPVRRRSSTATAAVTTQSPAPPRRTPRKPSARPHAVAPRGLYVQVSPPGPDDPLGDDVSVASAPPIVSTTGEIREQLLREFVDAEATMPFRRDALEGIESSFSEPEVREAVAVDEAAAATERTAPFRRDALEAIESSFSEPEVREAVAAVDEAAAATERTAPFRRDALAGIESADASPEPTMPFRRDAIMAIEEDSSPPHVGERDARADRPLSTGATTIGGAGDPLPDELAGLEVQELDSLLDEAFGAIATAPSAPSHREEGRAESGVPPEPPLPAKTQRIDASDLDESDLERDEGLEALAAATVWASHDDDARADDTLPPEAPVEAIEEQALAQEQAEEAGVERSGDGGDRVDDTLPPEEPVAAIEEQALAHEQEAEAEPGRLRDNEPAATDMGTAGPVEGHDRRTADKVAALPAVSPEEEEAVGEVLAEVAFFESQDLLDDALALVEEHIPSFPRNPSLLACRNRLRAALGVVTS